jgi:hypothetical protein
MKTRKEKIKHLTDKIKESIRDKKEVTAYFKNGGTVEKFKIASNAVRPF